LLWHYRGMQRFTTHDGIQLATFSGGDGPLVIALHGLIVHSEFMWPERLLADIAKVGWEWVALDARGHGASDGPHEPAAYADRAMARDVIALMDHLGATEAVLLGYSLGAYTAVETALLDKRVRGLILGGFSLMSVPDTDEGVQFYRDLAEGMLADEAPAEHFYREFADEIGADAKAIGCHLMGAALPQFFEPKQVAPVTVPTLIINGSEDADAGESARPFVDGRALTVPDDHIGAYGTDEFRDAVCRFLTELR